MRQIRLKAINLNDFSEEAKRYVARRILPQKIREATVIALPKLQEALGEAFDRTIVARGLQGDHSSQDNDIQAHFGMSSDEALSIYDSLKELFVEALSTSKIERRDLSVQFVYRTQDLIEAIKDSGIDYVLPSEGGDVPWLEWLTEGGTVEDFFIEFTLSESGKSVSRSGRALMQSAEGYNWTTEEYGRFSKTGKGFIVDILRDETFNREAEDIIKDVFREVFGS